MGRSESNCEADFETLGAEEMIETVERLILLVILVAGLVVLHQYVVPKLSEGLIEKLNQAVLVK